MPKPRWMPTSGSSQPPMEAPTIPTTRSPMTTSPVPCTMRPANQPATRPTGRIMSRLSADMTPVLAFQRHGAASLIAACRRRRHGRDRLQDHQTRKHTPVKRKRRCSGAWQPGVLVRFDWIHGSTRDREQVRDDQRVRRLWRWTGEQPSARTPVPVRGQLRERASEASRRPTAAPLRSS